MDKEKEATDALEEKDLIEFTKEEESPNIFEMNKIYEERLLKSSSERMIKDWRFAFGRQVNNNLDRPSNKDIMFAVRMIQEEFKELTDEIFGEGKEIKEENIKEFPILMIPDHLGDISWVTNGMMFLFANSRNFSGNLLRRTREHSFWIARTKLVPTPSHFFRWTWALGNWRIGSK